MSDYKLDSNIVIKLFNYDIIIHTFTLSKITISHYGLLYIFVLL